MHGTDLLVNVDLRLRSTCQSGFKIKFHIEPRRQNSKADPLTKIKRDRALSYEDMNTNHVSFIRVPGIFKLWTVALRTGYTHSTPGNSRFGEGTASHAAKNFRCHTHTHTHTHTHLKFTFESIAHLKTTSHAPEKTHQKYKYRRPEVCSFK